MLRLLHLTLLLVAVNLVSLGCGPNGPSTMAPAQTEAAASMTLNVFAAASLTNAFSEIGAGFSAAHPGAEVVFNFAGSNQLATQIGEGAPADVFTAANQEQMTAAIASGRILESAQRIFAHNRLLVIAPGDNPAGLNALADLARPDLKIVFAAAEVPVGRYTLEFLDKAAASGSLGVGYKDAVLANVVSYETNVRAVLSKVVLGEADAGIVYASDAAQSGEVKQIEISDELNSLASYPIAPLTDSHHPELAQQFVDYVLGLEGQKVLVAYGFAPKNGKDK